MVIKALGSSAPEILLSIIEIVANQFRAGDLGPGTIVGSFWKIFVSMKKKNYSSEIWDDKKSLKFHFFRIFPLLKISLSCIFLKFHQKSHIALPPPYACLFSW